MEPLRLKIKCEGLKRGKTSSGQEYLAIFFKGLITGFVPKDRLSNFVSIKKGDIVHTYVYSYQQGIKFIPQSYISCHDNSNDYGMSDAGESTGENNADIVN